MALSSGLRDIDIVRFRAQDLGGHTLVYVEQTMREGWRAIAKRVFDVALSIVALVLAAPILACRRGRDPDRDEGGRSSSPRIASGRDGKTFRMVKLRTMVADADVRKAELADAQRGRRSAVQDHRRPSHHEGRRVPAHGCRSTRSPSSSNVLSGEMSVVGPRPALPAEVEQWTEDVHDRLRVLPGITGMWQVSGRSDTTFDDYKRLDLYYVDNWSLAHDVRIVGRTFSAVLAKRGAK